MKRTVTAALVALGFLFAACQKPPAPQSGTSEGRRIVAIGTAVTETLYALDEGASIAGVDNASAEYFAQASSLPKIGPRNAVAAEGVISLKPTLVIAAAEAGPAAVLDQIRAAGIETVVLPTTSYTVDSVKSDIASIARAVGKPDKATDLVATIDRNLAHVRDAVAGAKPPRVLFVGRGPNMPNATMSGKGTTIDEMIRLAGGTNPMADFDGFKDMTDEAVVNAAPDIILMTEHSFDRSGGVDGVLKFPGVALTPAGKARAIVTVSDVYFQGFGPGLGQAVLELAAKFYPDRFGGPPVRPAPGSAVR